MQNAMRGCDKLMSRLGSETTYKFENTQKRSS